jgi:hypothetical protein
MDVTLTRKQLPQNNEAVLEKKDSLDTVETPLQNESILSNSKLKDNMLEGELKDSMINDPFKSCISAEVVMSNHMNGKFSFRGTQKISRAEKFKPLNMKEI